MNHVERRSESMWQERADKKREVPEYGVSVLTWPWTNHNRESTDLDYERDWLLHFWYEPLEWYYWYF